MKAKKVFENIEFKRGGSKEDITKRIGVGKYTPKTINYIDSHGGKNSITVINDEFKLYDYDVRLEFYDEFAEVFVDEEPSDIKMYFIKPAEYEFFVPNKPSIEINGKFESDPNPDNWSKTDSAYGFPLVDKNDKKKLKEMQQKYGYWQAENMGSTDTSKNPFVAAAKIIGYTY